MDDFIDSDYFSNEASTFGDRVAAGREALRLSQQEFAKKLGVKVKTVRAWEEDMAEPRANKLQMISGLTNVSLSWLLTGDGQGLEEPDEGVDISKDANDLLVDLRKTRAELKAMSDNLGRMEKRLQKMITEES